MLALKRVLDYLKSHVKRKVIYDTTIPNFSEYEIIHFNWFQCYLYATEEFPLNASVPKGKPVVNGYFDASHTIFWSLKD